MNKKRQKITFFIALVVLILVIPVIFFQIQKDKVAGVSTEREVKGLILPHHNVAQELIHDSINKIAEKQKPSVVVVLGPNHYFPDSPDIVTGFPQDFNYDTDFINNMQANFSDIIRNDEVTFKEHSIMTILPYIKQYLPEAKIIPLIIPTKIDDEKLNNKADFLATLPSNTLFIASVDFSHESLLTTGLEKNEESIKAIANFDFPTIYGYHDDHFDSPVSIALFLKIMQDLQALTWETWHSSHGAILLNDPALRGTSYVIGVFR